MSAFSLEVLETLDYDFTGIPSNEGPGKKCKGKGTIPEPTQPILEAYAASIRDLFGIKEDTESPEADAEAAIEKAPEEKAQAMLDYTAELCQHSPSADELAELPPRARNAFMKWVYKELSDPEV